MNEIIAYVSGGLGRAWMFVDTSHDAFKLALLLGAVFTIHSLIKKPLSQLIVWGGRKIATTRYFESFLDNAKMVSLAYWLIPLLVLNWLIPALSWDYNQVLHAVDLGHTVKPENIHWISTKGRLLDNFLYFSNFIYFWIWVFHFLKHTVEYLKNNERYEKKPLHSFAQIIFFGIFLVSLISIYSHFTQKSAQTLLTTLSVMSMAVFLTLKDVILGVVSTFMLIVTDSVRVGDSIVMKKYHAEGLISEINLISVKVINEDKSVVVIPTYSLISEGFENQELILGSRHKMVNIRMFVMPESVKVLNSKDIAKFRNTEYLAPYIEKREADFLKSNNKEIDYENTLNGKHFTNLGLFRKYVERMLKDHPMVFYPPNKSRPKPEDVELAPYVSIGEQQKEGLAIEICFFCNTTEKGEYNHLVSTVKEQLYAAAPEFSLLFS